MPPRLNLFGSPHLSRSADAAGRLDLPATAPSWLLAVLALADGWMARPALALLFWPDASTSEAQQKLRVTLHRSRQWLSTAGLGDALQAERQRVRLVLDSDVGAFRRAMDGGDWATALTLQPGPLLAGHALRGFAALDEWLADRREALRAQWRHAARARADVLERDGDVAAACALLRRQLDDDLLAEDALQALLRMAPAAGERSAALAAFERFRVRAGSELGLPPMPRTLALAQALRHAGEAPSPARSEPAAPVANLPAWPEVLSRPPLLAREAPLSALTAALSGGALSLVIVEGEAGIGKTRLVDAALGASPALRIEAGEPLQPAPLQALADALSGHVDAVRTLLPEPAWRRALARVMPALAHGGGAGGSEDGPAPQAALAALLSRWPGPLFVDDLQWLDEDSLAALAAALPSRTPGGLACVATLRPADAGHALRRWLAALESEGRLLRLALAPLPVTALERLASAAAGHALPRFAQGLARLSGGNPFLALECLRALHDEGRLPTADDAGDAVDPRDAAVTAAEVPLGAVSPRVAAAVRRRLLRLDEATARVLRVAALAGDAQAADALAELSCLSDWAVAEGLAQAQAAGLLDGRRFAHDLVRQVLVDDTPEPVRALLHAGIARRLADRLPPHAVAAHWWAAGDAAAALQAALSAADHDAQRGLLDAAERLLAETAVRLGEAPPLALDAARLDVARAYVARQRGEMDAAATHAARALAALPMPATRQAALVECFEVELARGRLADAARWLAQARDIDPDRPTLWLDEAKLAHAQGDVRGCAELTGRYVRWLRRQPPGTDLAGALTSQGVALDIAGEHAAASPLHEEAMAIARRIGATAVALEAAGNLVFCLGEQGRDADAARVGLQAMARAGELFNAPLASNTAYSLLALGRLAEAEPWYRRVMGSSNASAACAASGKLLEIAARRGVPEPALAAAVDAVFDALARTEMWTVQAGALVAVLVHGRPADAERVRPWLRDEPLYPGLQQRLDEALARHPALRPVAAR